MLRNGVSRSATPSTDLIRYPSHGLSSIADRTGAALDQRPPIGIDLFVHHGMKACDWQDGRTCHVSASIGKETAAPTAGAGACSDFGLSRSERVFRNEFPYLGRASRAAWAGLRCIGGDRSGRLVCYQRGARPSSGARSQGEVKGAASRRSRTSAVGSAGSPSWPSGRTAAPGSAGSTDLCALDQVLPEGAGR